MEGGTSTLPPRKFESRGWRCRPGASFSPFCKGGPTTRNMLRVQGPEGGEEAAVERWVSANALKCLLQGCCTNRVALHTHPPFMASFMTRMTRLPAPHLPLCRHISQVAPRAQRLLEGRGCGHKRRQRRRLAHVCDGGQEQEVLRTRAQGHEGTRGWEGVGRGKGARQGVGWVE